MLSGQLKQMEVSGLIERKENTHRFSQKSNIACPKPANLWSHFFNQFADGGLPMCLKIRIDSNCLFQQSRASRIISAPWTGSKDFWRRWPGALQENSWSRNSRPNRSAGMEAGRNDAQFSKQRLADCRVFKWRWGCNWQCFAIDDIERNRIELPQFVPVNSISQSTVCVGDVITYTVTSSRTCLNPLVNNFFIGVSPDGLVFIDGSVAVNGAPDITANLNSEIVLPNIAGGDSVTVTFQAGVTSVPLFILRNEADLGVTKSADQATVNLGMYGPTRLRSQITARIRRWYPVTPPMPTPTTINLLLQ